MNKFIKKIIGATLGLAMAVGVGVAIGSVKEAVQAKADEAIYKTALFGSSYNSAGVSSYTDSWYSTNNGFRVNLQNFNNNNNGWSTVKCGRKNNASVATIITDAAIDEAVTKVSITVSAITTSKVNSITLYSSSNGTSWSSEGTFTKETGAKAVSVSSPAEDKYYKIEFDCASGSSNGLVELSRVDYYYNAPTPVSSISLASTNYTPADGVIFVAKGQGDLEDTLTPTILPDNATNKTVNWSSDNESVAAVDDGEVLIDTSAIGEATITATAADGSGKSASITYSVYDPNATYSVTYHGNGNTSGDIPTDDNEYDNGDEVTVAGAGTLAKTNYVFSGWNTLANGTGTPYSAGDTFSISADIDLFAQWVDADSVSAKSNPLGIYVNQTYNLEDNVTVKGAGALSFSIGSDAYADLDGNNLTGKAAGSVVVTATKGEASTSFTVNITVADAGTVYNPYSVAQAKYAIDNGGNTSGVYVKGIIYSVNSYSNGAITYWISDDGSSAEFEVYNGKSFSGANFSAKADLSVYQTVVVYGNITLYNSTIYEFGANSQLVSRENPVATQATIAFAAGKTGQYYDGTTQNSKISTSDFVITKKTASGLSAWGSVTNGKGFVLNIYKNGELFTSIDASSSAQSVAAFTGADLSSGSVAYTVKAVIDEIETPALNITVSAKQSSELTVTYSGPTSYREYLDDYVAPSSENVSFNLAYNDGASSASYNTVISLVDVAFTSNKTDGEININDYLTDGHFVVSETTVFTVTYTMKDNALVSGSYSFTVKNFDGIVASDATDRNYYAGEEYDITVSVVATFGGVEEPITSGFTYSPTHIAPTEAGTQRITVNAGLLGSPYFDLTINPEITLVSVAITSNPTKTAYKFGEAFSSAGLVVTATYSDSNTNNVTGDCSLSAYDPYKLGTQTINVSYHDEVVGSFNVTNTNVGATLVNPTPNAGTLATGNDTKMSENSSWSKDVNASVRSVRVTIDGDITGSAESYAHVITLTVNLAAGGSETYSVNSFAPAGSISDVWLVEFDQWTAITSFNFAMTTKISGGNVRYDSVNYSYTTAPSVSADTQIQSYAQFFLDTTDVACAEFVDEWSTLKAEFEAMTDAAKALFSTSGNATVIAAYNRYVYLTQKADMKASFSAFDGVDTSGAKNVFAGGAAASENGSMIAFAALIAVAGIATAGAFFVLRKRKQQEL